jgi:hypothetical protein
VPLRRVYDLRHTFATFALRAGISTFDLSCYMGASLTISTATTATSHATDESTQSGSWTATRTSKPTTSKPWTSNGRRSCPSSPATTTERPLEQEETESPLTDSNRRPPPYHAIVAATGRNRRQRFRLILRFSGAGHLRAGCHRLQPRGSIKAPSFVVCTGYVSGTGEPNCMRSWASVCTQVVRARAAKPDAVEARARFRSRRRASLR